MRKIRDLRGYALQATDGMIGRLEECFFDDQSWSVRYLVVNTGTWLTGREVLIRPGAIGRIDDERRVLGIRLSRARIENSPPFDSEKPVSRQHEEAYHRYYGLPPYWETGLLPELGFPPVPAPGPGKSALAEAPGGDPHLRSTAEVAGYTIEGLDGEIGHVEDFIIHDRDLKIHYFEVSPSTWWPGKKVLVPVAWVQGIRWNDSKTFVSLERDDVRSAPVYDPSQMITRRYEVELFKYYSGKKKTSGR